MTQLMDAFYALCFIVQVVIMFFAVYNIIRACKNYDLGMSFILFSIATLCYGMIVFLTILNYNVEFYYMFIDMPTWLYLFYGILFVVEVLMAVVNTLYNPFSRGEPNDKK